ncbi:hypothetical protein HRE53_29690 (plasmid) [Acaryochloris sp. 'Moss Beach']|uniref:hypothetical protein n=1 Tax=Acaryochloris sp. 'Moss Beach' TaxID=2740837 RepID=UPI001F2F6D55|nr:hypothetical protein [Acaryochloris sp. 'Moss Beach']UJB72786.1 hypothetical protein HRE53_29690 [Acaryochloris sp. 'Moss Beach']
MKFKKTLSLVASASVLLMSFSSSTFAQENSEDLSFLEPCAPKAQGRYKVNRMDIIGEMPYKDGKLYHTVIGFEGQAEDVEGEVVIFVGSGSCKPLYTSSYWGNTPPLTDVFDQSVSRQLAYQWLKRRVTHSGFDAIQKSLIDPRLKSLPDHTYWAYKELGFSIPSHVRIKD